MRYTKCLFLLDITFGYNWHAICKVVRYERNIDRIINLETKKIIKKVVFDYLVELQIWGNEAANIMEHYMDEDSQ